MLYLNMIIQSLALCSGQASEEFVVMDWGSEGGRQVQRAHAIQVDATRYMFFSSDSEIRCRVGTQVDGNWRYRKSKPIISPGGRPQVAMFDSVRVENPSIVEGKFNFKFGRGPNRKFKYLMSYDGFSGSQWTTLFAFSESLMGPWIKAGPLLRASLPDNVKALQPSMVAEGTGAVRMFFVQEVDGVLTPATCKLSCRNLADLYVSKPKPIRLNGLATADGNAAVRLNFATFAMSSDRKSYLTIRNVSESRAEPVGVFGANVGLSSISKEDLTASGGVWLPQRLLGTDRHNEKFIGLAGFVKSPTGEVVLDDQGRVQVLITLRQSRQGAADPATSRVVEYRIPYSP